MNQPLHNELKKEFQLERLILFSDAVFAIAITLLVIEIKIPEVHENVSDKLLLHELKHLVPKFAGFIISFALIGLYWTLHHKLFGFVTNYDKKLLRMNLIFLFFIALMPFSTGFYSEYSGTDLIEKQLIVPMSFYSFNLFCVGMMNFLMWQHICNKKNKLAVPAVPEKVAGMAKARSFLVPSIFLLMVPVAYFIDVVFAIYIPFLIPIALRIIQRKYK